MLCYKLHAFFPRCIPRKTNLQGIRFMKLVLPTFVYAKTNLSEPVFWTTMLVDFLRNGIPSFRSKIIKINMMFFRSIFINCVLKFSPSL